RAREIITDWMSEPDSDEAKRFLSYYSAVVRGVAYNKVAARYSADVAEKMLNEDGIHSAVKRFFKGGYYQSTASGVSGIAYSARRSGGRVSWRYSVRVVKEDAGDVLENPRQIAIDQYLS